MIFDLKKLAMGDKFIILSHFIPFCLIFPTPEENILQGNLKKLDSKELFQENLFLKICIKSPHSQN